MKIPQAISRMTGPNIGVFVLILMHFYAANPKYNKDMHFFLIFHKYKINL